MTRPSTWNRPLLARLFPPTTARPSRQNPSQISGTRFDPVPVIALHGTLDSPSAWVPLADGLRARGRRVFTPAYGNRGTAAIADSVAEVETYINKICAETDSDTVDIVAHSQGGLVAFLLYEHLANREAGQHGLHNGMQRVSFRRVISVSGSIGGVKLTGFSRILGWRDGALARWLMGQALADQIAVAAGKYELPVPNAEARAQKSKATSTDWINVISHDDRLVIPWSDSAQRFLPNSRTILLDTELDGRSVPHWKQQTDPGVIALLTRLLT